MRRREFTTMFAGAAAWPLVARAQEQALPTALGLEVPDKLLALADEVIE